MEFNPWDIFMPLLTFGVAVVLEPRRFLEQFLVVMPLASVDTILEPSITAIMAKGQVMWQFLAWMAPFAFMPLLPMLISFIPKDTVLTLLTTTVVLRPVRRAPTTAWTR